MAQNSKWVAFGNQLVFKKSKINGVYFNEQEGELEIFVSDFGRFKIHKKNHSNEQWGDIKNDFYEYQGSIKYA